MCDNTKKHDLTTSFFAAIVAEPVPPGYRPHVYRREAVKKREAEPPTLPLLADSGQNGANQQALTPARRPRFLSSASMGREVLPLPSAPNDLATSPSRPLVLGRTRTKSCIRPVHHLARTRPAARQREATGAAPWQVAVRADQKGRRVEEKRNSTGWVGVVVVVVYDRWLAAHHLQ